MKCVSFIKRGQNEHIKALFEKGEVYISTVDFIKNCDESGRGDSHEGLIQRFYIPEGEVFFKSIDEVIDENDIGIPFKSASMIIPSGFIGNIYSFSTIYRSDLEAAIEMNEKILLKTRLHFGEAAVFIRDCQSFIDRIVKALIKKGFIEDDIQVSVVEYYSEEYQGSCGYFMKHQDYSYQKEVRILVKNPTNQAIKLYIGSIEDIAWFSSSGALKGSLSYISDDGGTGSVDFLCD